MASHRFPWKWSLSELPGADEAAPKVFSTFACGGGSSMGYKLAGYDVLGNCEIDPKIASVYSANLHPRMSFVEDIREFNTRDALPEELYALDVLDGSPPCSTFSISGSREDAWGKEKRFAEGQKLQTLDDLFFVYLDTVERLMPKVSVAENVVGLLRGNARGYVNAIVKRYREIGYDVQLFKLDSSSMGVPQKRERVFFVANRMGYPKLELSFDEPEVHFGEVRSKYGGKEFGKRAEGLIAKAIPGDDGLGDVSRRTEGREILFNYRFVFDDRPSKTIPAQNQLIRKCDGTRMTLEDVRNVSTFPQDYDFKGQDYNFICGMSVPPVMMANLAYEIREQWLSG